MVRTGTEIGIKQDNITIVVVVTSFQSVSSIFFIFVQSSSFSSFLPPSPVHQNISLITFFDYFIHFLPLNFSPAHYPHFSPSLFHVCSFVIHLSVSYKQQQKLHVLLPAQAKEPSLFLNANFYGRHRCI